MANLNYKNSICCLLSVLDNGQVGSGFVIPELKAEGFYHLGKGCSIFTAELIAILMALTCIINYPKILFRILICCDSQAVLQALNSINNSERSEIIYEIKTLIHSLIVNGTQIDFCWIPSHCGFRFNERADTLAKLGAMKAVNSVHLNIGHSKNELNNIIKKYIYGKISFTNHSINAFSCSRTVSSLVYRLILDSLKTKYCKDVKCLCNENLSVHHILFDCDQIRLYLPHTFISAVNNGLTSLQGLLFDNLCIVFELALSLLQSPIGRFLLKKN